MKALRMKHDAFASPPVSSHLNFAGCRLRAYASTLRADLVRDLEARLLVPVAAEACPKPLRIFVPPATAVVDPAPVPARASASFRRSASLSFLSNGSASLAAEEDAAVLASCVLTDSGELLVADHSDDGLAALCPRSLGFLATGLTLPPVPEPSHRGQALRRYPIVLQVHRPITRRRASGYRAAADPTLSKASEAEELVLFAPSRNQYNALRRAVETLSAAVQSNSTPRLSISTDVGECDNTKGARESQGNARAEEPKTGKATKEVQVPLSYGKGDCQPSVAFAPLVLSHPHNTPFVCTGTVAAEHPTAAPAVYDSGHLAQATVADINDQARTQAGLSPSRTRLVQGCNAGDHGPLHNPVSGPGSAAVESTAVHLREQIAAAREGLVRIMSHAALSPLPTTVHPVGAFLATTHAAAGADLFSSLAAAAINISMSPFHTSRSDSRETSHGVDLEIDSDSEDAAVEGGGGLTAHMEMRAATAGLLAGLDAAMMLRIHRFAAENARLRACLKKGTGNSSFRDKAEASADAAAAADESIVISGGPVFQSIAIVSVRPLIVPLSVVCSHTLPCLNQHS